MKRIFLTGLVAFLCLAIGDNGQAQPAQDGWSVLLARKLPAFGHRNWIVIADSAYPAQTRAGILTVTTDADHFAVLEHVLKLLGKATHIRPVVYLDAELPFVSEKDAPGISKVRAALAEHLKAFKPQSLPHEQIIDKLDKAGEKFQVLVLKTTLELPYTSVFLQLDCGYWSPEAEQRLREAIKKAGPK